MLKVAVVFVSNAYKESRHTEIQNHKYGPRVSCSILIRWTMIPDTNRINFDVDMYKVKDGYKHFFIFWSYVD